MLREAFQVMDVQSAALPNEPDLVGHRRLGHAEESQNNAIPAARGESHLDFGFVARPIGLRRDDGGAVMAGEIGVGPIVLTITGNSDHDPLETVLTMLWNDHDALEFHHFHYRADLPQPKHPLMRAFTANPSLMKAGAHRSYACELVESVSDRHISFEVLSDGVAEMVAQARVINAWGGNAPITVSAVSPWRTALQRETCM
jgi:hypothetical protein